MRVFLLYLSIVTLSGCASATSSCITNRDCVSNICVNGSCASARRDGGPLDAETPPDSDVCEPWTCESLGQVCRDADDGCGGRVSCGTPGTVSHGPIITTPVVAAEVVYEDVPQQILTHRVCFDEVPSVANGFGEGMYFQFTTSAIDGVGFDYGIRDRTFDLGNVPGVIFSKDADNDPAHVRLGPNSVMSDIRVTGVNVGIRMPLMLSVGCYEATLEVGEASAGGDWVEFNISRGGSNMNVGALWFARQNPAQQVSFSNSGRTGVIFFGADGRRSDVLPRYDFRIIRIPDVPRVQRIEARYYSVSNTSCEYLANSGELRFLVGGDTFRCVPGVLDEDTYRQVWTPR